VFLEVVRQAGCKLERSLLLWSFLAELTDADVEMMATIDSYANAQEVSS